MDIKVVLIRSESDINGFFTLTSRENEVRKTWSCDQGALEPDDEHGALDLTEEQYDKLFHLWNLMTISPWPEEGEEHVCDYAVFDFETGKCLTSWTSPN